MKIQNFFLYLVALTVASCAHAAPTLNFNDTYPLYTTLYNPTILNQQAKEILKENVDFGIKERFLFSLSLFGQKATTANDEEKNTIRIGDIHGRLGMLPLTYGTIPNGVVQPTLLQAAGAQTYSAAVNGVYQPFSNPTFADETQNFGFFSSTLKYSKVGIRMEAAVRFWDNCIFIVQGGAADLQLTFTTEPMDQTANATTNNVYPTGTTVASFDTDKGNVQRLLMEPSSQVFKQIGVNVGNVQKTGGEDVTVSVMLRHNFPVNKGTDPDNWAYFIFTPYLQLGGTLPAATPKDPNQLYDLCLGNNRHYAFNLNGGLNFDFKETMEVGVQAGISHFFNRSCIMRVPTSTLQYTLFPYSTTVNVSPGNTWFVGVSLNTYHFIDNLSLYAEFIYTAHLQDTITLLNADSAFIPTRLEQDTPWKAQVANIGVNYDISPNFSMGFAWQAPLSTRGAYNSSTLLLGANLTF